MQLGRATVRGETSRVKLEITVDAKPDAAFAYFVEPEKMARWIGMGAILDPRPHGILRIDVNGATVIGEFVQVARPWRLVFTWGWQQELFTVPPQSTTVEVSFTPLGDGTFVGLTHCHLPPPAVTFHRVGWEHYLRRLAVAAAGGNPGRDRFAAVEAARRAIENGVTRSA
jgi:uncharacterized protein YndB with AHSA1/START domain